MDRQSSKSAELDRLLNDPDVMMRPDLVWQLADELAARLAAPDDRRRGGSIRPH